MARITKIILIAAFCVSVLSSFSLCSSAPADQRKELGLHYYRGVVNFEAGKYEDALAEFQAAAAIDPFYKDVQKYIEHSVKILEQSRQDVLGLKDGSAAKAKELDLYFLGKSYYEKGDYRRAMETFKAVLAKQPNDKFAKYYLELCKNALPGGADAKKTKRSRHEQLGLDLQDLEKEVSYIKNDVKEQEDMETFLEAKAQRRADREELIRKKERQLKEQEALLEEERQDYLAQEKIAKQANKIRQETEKWKNMKERLASKQPGIPADLTEFPVYLNKAENYYRSMKESLRASRWNSAGLDAIHTSLYYCDALLIYFYGLKSAFPQHENITRLLMANVKRADVDENVFYLRSILNLKNIVESEDRAITRSEAIFAAEKAEKIAEWCKSIIP